MSGKDLLNAAEKGDTKTVASLLNKEINVDFKDSVSNV
jgi:hypothetical protein